MTALVQSSNATALLVTSFVAQGLVGLAPALVIMLGADVGTALMARVLTFDLSRLSPLLILIGVFLFLSRKQMRIGQIGRVLIGLGLIVLALELIVAAATPITRAAGVKVLFSSLTGDVMLDALTGALFAIVSYSSGGGAADRYPDRVRRDFAEGGALHGDRRQPRQRPAGDDQCQRPERRRAARSARQPAVQAGGVRAGAAVRRLSGGCDGSVARRQRRTGDLFPRVLQPDPLLGDDPLAGPMATLCERLILDVAADDPRMRPRHLDASALDTPTLALANAARETLRMGDVVEHMMILQREVLHGKQGVDKEVRRLDDDVDVLYTAIKLYLAQIQKEDLGEEDSRRWAEIIEMALNPNRRATSSNAWPATWAPSRMPRAGPSRRKGWRSWTGCTSG